MRSDENGGGGAREEKRIRLGSEEDTFSLTSVFFFVWFLFFYFFSFRGNVGVRFDFGCPVLPPFDVCCSAHIAAEIVS